MREVSEPSFDQHEKSVEESTKSIKTGNEKLGNTIPKGVDNYYEVTRRKKKILTKLTNSNVNSASIVKFLADFMNSKYRSQFGLNHFDENTYTINPHSPKIVILKEKYLLIYDSDGIV